MHTLFTYLIASAVVLTAEAGDAYKSLRSIPIVSATACASDTPTLVIPMKKTGSVLRCANECNRAMDECLVYQYNKPLGEYNTATTSVDASSVCLFPFTSDGQLYYQCAVNYSTTPYDVWCFTSYNQRNTCDAALSYGYVAKNATVNVTITPTITVALQVVAGWLTILSRVDTSFPIGQPSSAYIDGFGNIADNFWLGLEKVYQLTNYAVNGGRTYKLRFELLVGNNWYSIEYDWFHLDDSTTEYIFRASTTFNGDAPDNINNSGSSTNNKPFASSTSYTCVRNVGPWWFHDPAWSCSFCRLLGDASGQGSHWEMPNTNGQLQVVRMMVKAID